MSNRGILVISHGSRDDSWVTLIDEAVASVASALSLRLLDAAERAEGSDAGALESGTPIVSSFLEIVEGRLIQDGIDRLEAEGVTELYVLPLFVSSGSTHVDDIAQGFGLPPVSPDREGELGRFRLSPAARVRFGTPIDDQAEIAEVLLGNIRELSESPEREALLLVAHGSKEEIFHDRWRLGLSRLAEQMRTIGGFAEAAYAMLLPDQAAERLSALLRERPELDVIVAPLFLSDGYFTQKLVPGRLEGLAYRYNGRPMLPNPGILRWMVSQIELYLNGRDGHIL
ncbi:sirohydrochlorin chelatase [Paenibacillus methanolicus]|uniref:Sirohydrochlorin ferrochelatase n=1 Tax=Paenibacillus methanolicus TaxID=582686 RepID=A0A5S5BQY3_9BACL|nr:CbiX/SirB N-terminal domain-containing protein [Paenibacillus methanolicus]TYP69615.1 sirohydrochlorin ferrochelatase [Paenibacillus methanolicus]